MTEAEWLSCAEPAQMLGFLLDKASDRKLRLFACAYARTGSWLQEFSHLCFAHFYEGWGRPKPEIDVAAAQAALLALRRSPLLGANTCTFRGQPPCGDDGEKIVTLAELCAEGLCPAQELDDVRRQLEPKLNDARTGAAYCGPSAFRPAEEYHMLLATVQPVGKAAAQKAFGSAEHYFVAVADGGPRRGLNPEFRAPVRQQTWLLQAELLREIFGNPFRTPAVDPGWRTRDVTALAQGIHAERAFERMPILADALEDVGCVDPAILDHCRQPGEHVRGCWVVDLVLGNL